MSAIKILIDIDTKLFLFLNGLHHPITDFIMYWFSDKYIWIPLYILLIVLAAIKYKWKSILWIVLGTIAIIIADAISVYWFKNVFLRLRPCHEPALEGLVHLVKGKCGGMYSFVSSHATNHFTIAVFWSLLLKPHFRYSGSLLIIWASLVAYSRIYLGVHYPLDVIGGALLGSLIGFLVFVLAHFSAKRLFLTKTLSHKA